MFSRLKLSQEDSSNLINEVVKQLHTDQVKIDAKNQALIQQKIDDFEKHLRATAQEVIKEEFEKWKAQLSSTTQEKALDSSKE